MAGSKSFLSQILNRVEDVYSSSFVDKLAYLVGTSGKFILNENGVYEDDNYSRAAARINRRAEQVPANIARFIYNYTNEFQLRGLEQHIKDVGITTEEFISYIADLAGGILAAYELLGEEVAEVPIFLTKESATLAVHSPYTKKPEICIGLEQIADVIKHGRTEVVDYNHAPRVDFDTRAFARATGFEEAAHGFQKLRYPHHKDSALVKINRNFDSVDKQYYTICAEVFAGLHAREQLRRDNPGNTDILYKTYETDCFILQRMRDGKLDDLPEEIKDLARSKIPQIDEFMRSDPEFAGLSAVCPYSDENKISITNETPVSMLIAKFITQGTRLENIIDHLIGEQQAAQAQTATRG